MVEPHRKWDEVSDGYEDGSVGIFVEPAVVQTGDGYGYQSSGGIDDADANAYSVDLRTGLGTISETWDPVTRFESSDDAWAFAAVLTHYIEAEPVVESAKSNLLHADPDYPGEVEDMPTVVADLTPAETFRRLIHPSPVPDAVADVLE